MSSSELSFLPTSEAVALALLAIDRVDRALERSEIAVARREVLEHIMLEGITCSRGLASPPLGRRGVKRYATPEDKPTSSQRTSQLAKRAAQKAVACDDTTYNSIAKPIPAICANASSRRCQVCQLDASWWTSNEPCLLNAHDRAVKVPGDFCSKACYQHI